MIGKKKKITKKELQEDKLVSSFYKTQDFVEENKQKLIFAFGAIAVVILAITWYFNKRAEDNILAGQKLTQIVPVFEQGDYKKAIDGEPGTQLDGLQSIVNNYSGTEQGELAKIYLAKSYYFLGDFENAAKYFDDYSGESKLHQSAAFAGLAACNEHNSEYEKAAELYEKAAKFNNLSAQTADFLLNAGINYKKSGDSESAKIVFERIKDDYNTSSAAREVDKYLSQIL
jgi:tetratricopeptide (TPR) repeat protein